MWHSKTWNWPKNEEWEVEHLGLLKREFICDEARRMEYGNLFTYLYRRFGPPEDGCDPYKEIACWYLTTPDPNVILWVSPRPSGAIHSFGYGIRQPLADNLTPRIERTAIQSLQSAMRDLLVPTNVRDVFINALGPVPDVQVKRTVKPFKYAGIGVDHKELAKLAKEGD